MSITRRSAMSCYHVFYKRIKQNACVYCGLRATTIDHFVPISVVSMITQCGVHVDGKFLLPSCGECNSICGPKIFKTVACKRRFVQEKLKRKYERVLKIPIWKDEEIEELEWAMKSYVLAGMAQKNVLQQRIAWRNTSNATYVEIAKIRFGLLAPGQNIVVKNANSKMHTKEERVEKKYPKKTKHKQKKWSFSYV